MSTTTMCPQCGGELPPNFPQGICPACLLRQGMQATNLTGGSNSGQRASWTPPTVAEVAGRFPQLDVVELLGQGGMGAVYKVRQRGLDRWAALKILPDAVASDPTFSERFQREARALAQLNHQHIVVVYEFGQKEGIYFLLMEYVDGVTLRQASRAGQLTTKDALLIVTQMCEALQFAHEEGVVHRDIKPENILIDKRGRVKIADFGLAKLLGQANPVPTLTGTRQVMGTPMYMAPEQMEGAKGVDHRADIFSLGVVFYELLTGELPLGRFAPPSQKYSLDARLDDVVFRTLEKEPDRRYQQASDLKGDVETIRNQPAVVKAMPSRTWLSFVKSSLLGLGLGLAIVAALSATTYWLSFTSQVNHQAAVTTENRDKPSDRSVEAEPLRQSAANPETRDSIVQFTPTGVKLHPQFGPLELAGAQRDAVEKIMNRRHQEYLALESRATQRDVRDSAIYMNIGKFADDPGQSFSDAVEKLEDAFWTDIDSAVPVPQQTFLRHNLPLYADPNKPLPRSIPISMFAGPAAFCENLRNPQLFGWKVDPEDHNLELSIALGRRGKWFTWKFEKASHGGRYLDEGEAPELPAGLRRLWQEPLLEAGPTGGATVVAPAFHPEELAEISSEGQLEWTETGVRLSEQFAEQNHLNGEPLVKINAVLTEMHRKYLGIEAQFVEEGFGQKSMSLLGPLKSQISTIHECSKEQAKLAVELWKKLDAVLSDNEKSGDALHQKLPLVSIGNGSNYPGLFGWKSKLNGGFHLSPCTIEIWMVGDWFHWKITPRGGSLLEGVRKGQLPWELRRFWREATPPRDAPDPDLDQQLRDLDKLRAGADTPWEEVEKRTNQLLEENHSAADCGRIHWMAAHVYGQSDIRGHAEDVTRHAQEALKLERDPGQRGWLYMYLGDAAGITQHQADATRWYLKGYLELLPYHLPEVAPELPNVGLFRRGGGNVGPDDGEPDLITREVLQAAEMKVRKEAELIRDLVKWRNVYIGQVQNQYGHMSMKGSDADLNLRKLATEVLREERLVQEFLQRIWPGGTE